MKSTIRSLSEVESSQRWDFGYHDPDYLAVMKSLDRCYPVSRLGNIITLLTDMGAFSLYKTEFFVDEGVPFLRVQNIQEYGVDLTKNTKYISVEYHEQLKKSQLQPGDILLTTKAVIGVAAVVDEHLGKCNISQNLVRIRLKNGINPHYVAVLLNTKLGRMQTETAATGPNQKYLNFERIQDLKITLPPQPIQDCIAQVMQDAYATKLKKITEAEKVDLYASNYVLKKLGIHWSGIEDVKQFNVPITELVGSRFDTRYQSPRVKYALALLESCDYPVKPLGELIAQIHYGASVKNAYSDQGIPFIRIGNLKPNYLDVADIVYFDESQRNLLGKAFVKTEDLLMSRSGSVGIVAVVPPEADGFAFGSFQIKFRLHHGSANPFFIAYVLNSPIGNAQVEQQKTGSIQMNITIEGIKALKVPLPAIGLQNEIVQEADEQRVQAKRLRTEAETIVTEAKARVERMILGEEDAV
ncbi:restriction endonuclease subunit S [Microcoleus sp. FACHB-SPT15]|uniref:restriction endonuclease subunit S n=1 Tax=Microcoleus sp. FACHB-SPT15 TaxID=2692830 RepID=UPI001780DAF4|nr:restriction endonuclease subunit S [Microcoleus sp. FACHB-SPT15]MBD1808105.1 restriction endonuclease subunit S [Microcoleus sp. FACHB-SPT15]